MKEGKGSDSLADKGSPWPYEDVLELGDGDGCPVLQIYWKLGITYVQIISMVSFI